jgi:hypothetical protein
MYYGNNSKNKSKLGLVIISPLFLQTLLLFIVRFFNDSD